jgi:hypothetical protein
VRPRNIDYFSVGTHEVGKKPVEYVRFDAVCLSLICGGRVYDVPKSTVFCPRCEDALVWMPIRKNGLPKRFYAGFGAKNKRVRPKCNKNTKN